MEFYNNKMCDFVPEEQVPLSPKCTLFSALKSQKVSRKKVVSFITQLKEFEQTRTPQELFKIAHYTNALLSNNV